MADTVLNVRLRQRADTFENWSRLDTPGLYGNLVLEAGEVGWVILPASVSTESYGQTAPTMLSKVGDGVHPFSELKWASALAADVYSWAKEKTKPTYLANEIYGLEQYVTGIAEDTDTQYTIVKLPDGTIDGSRYELLKKGKDDADFVSLTPNVYIDIPKASDDAAINEAIDAIWTELDGITGTGEGSITKIVNDSIAAVVANAPTDFDTLKEISDWITTHSSSAAEMNSEILTLKGQAHTHDNKAILDGVTTEKVAAWDAAEANSKKYTDEEIAKLDMSSIIGPDALWVLDCGTSTKNI